MASRSDSASAPANGSPVATSRPVLSRALLHRAEWRAPASLVCPERRVLDLPERAIQFGTGAFLRGFVEYFVDEANRKGLFNGRVVVVGSTGSGRDRAFATQDGLFTLESLGADSRDDESRIVASVSRALNAQTGWGDVLAVARQPDIAVVFSNTTEAGFALHEADVAVDVAPRSFPAKLTQFLYERARTFQFDAARGVVVIPCELLEDNGDVLRSLVHELARRWRLDSQFFTWLNAAVPFCNTLVDRIVPGAPPERQREKLESKLGYSDELLTVAESYRLFVIEAEQSIHSRIPFLLADDGIVVTNNIRPYRERKVRLLNGTHTGLAAVGMLAGLKTVDAAMRDTTVASYARDLLHGAILPMVDAPEASTFGDDVLRRFANPHVHHRLTDIATQGTLKLRVRLLPIVERYAQASEPVPQALIAAIAAQLVLLHPQSEHQLRSSGDGFPSDELGVRVRAHWEAVPHVAGGVEQILSDRSIWGDALTLVPDLALQVADVAATILSRGIRSVLHAAGDAALIAPPVIA